MEQRFVSPPCKDGLMILSKVSKRIWFTNWVQSRWKDTDMVFVQHTNYEGPDTLQLQEFTQWNSLSQKWSAQDHSPNLENESSTWALEAKSRRLPEIASWLDLLFLDRFRLEWLHSWKTSRFLVGLDSLSVPYSACWCNSILYPERHGRPLERSRFNAQSKFRFFLGRSRGRCSSR